MKKVLVGGCFDLLHFGHISFLKAAKQLGNHLVVALESDESVRRMKGPARPIHSQKQRQQMLASVSFVDEIILLAPMRTDEEYLDLVKRVQPTVIAITQGDPIKEKKEHHAQQVNATLVEIPKIHTPSTSQLAKLLELE
jgi:rfaE bifunctional protein nucleotidyltransferase chain/domain